MLLVTYGVMFGIGNGLAYTVLVGCAMKWWPKWSGIASSVVLFGYGLSAFLFNADQTWFINPENSKPMNIPYIDHPSEKYFGQQEVLEKVPLVFLLLALCYAGLQGIGTVFISYPHMVDSKEDQDSENKESSKAETDNSSDSSLQPQQNNDSKVQFLHAFLDVHSSWCCYCLLLLIIQNICTGGSY